MKVIKKDATITPTGTVDDFPGTFEVVLSAPTLDRDGETLYPEEWKTPLPERITFDIDHGMSVGSTVGSGVPRIDEKSGKLIVSGTYSSLDRAQEVRTLVNEGHIDRTSVAFMSDRTTKDGKTTVKRELLNGAFVAIPSNREAVVLSSKGMKSGARHSATDLDYIKQIHDLAALLLADSTIPEADLIKSVHGVTAKAVQGSLEETQERCSDALTDAYGHSAYVWLVATLPDSLVFQISQADSSDSDTYQQSYTDDGQVVTLTGERAAVDLTQIVKPDPDDADPAEGSGPVDRAKAPAAPPETKAQVAESPTDEELAAKALQIIAGQFS